MGLHQEKQYIIEVTGGEENKNRKKLLVEEIIAKNIPNLTIDSYACIEEVQDLNKINSNWRKPRHIVIKMAKASLDPESSTSQNIFKRSPVKLTDLSNKAL